MEKQYKSSIIKVPIAASKNDVCLQNTNKSNSCNLKIWHLLWLYG